VVAPHLLADVSQGVEPASLFELVHHHQVGVVQHVDLLELAGRAILGRHHVQADVRDADDVGVPLPDAGGLHDDQVEGRRLAYRDCLADGSGQLSLVASRRERPHVHPVRVEGIHPDAIAEQGATGTPAGGVDRDHRHAVVGIVQEIAPQQLVGQGGLPRAPGPGDADHGDVELADPILQGVPDLGGQTIALHQILLGEGDHAGDGASLPLPHVVQGSGGDS